MLGMTEFASIIKVPTCATMITDAFNPQAKVHMSGMDAKQHHERENEWLLL